MVSILCFGPIAAMQGVFLARREIARIENSNEDMEFHGLALLPLWICLPATFMCPSAAAVFISDFCF